MSLFAELKRRNVFRVAAAYVVFSWLTLQIGDVLFEFMDVPDWAGRILIAFLILAFIPALFFAWAFELTPEGIKKEADVDRSQSITDHTGRRLDYITLAALAGVVALVLVDRSITRTPDQAGDSAAIIEDSAKSDSAPAPVQEDSNRRSIAVLPFTNRSAESDTAYFVDGIHDDLLTHLARIGDLKVISRTSVMEYRDTTKNLKQIGSELGVTTILEGAVQRAGNRVRINAQLIDAETDEHLWADIFDRELSVENIFDIQSDIARSIAQALAATLSPEVGERLDSIPTTNQEAYDLYLRALSMDISGDPNRHTAAINVIRQAVETDPGFALAYSELGRLQTDQYWFFDRDPETLAKARESHQRAMELAPDDPRVLINWGEHLYHGYLDYEGALEVLDRASRLLPNDAELYFTRGAIRRRQGRFEDAIKDFHRTIELNPRSAFASAELANTYAAVLDIENAKIWQQRTIDLDHDTYFSLLTFILVDLAVLGETRSAREYFDRHQGEAWANFLYSSELQVLMASREYERAMNRIDAWPSDLLGGQQTFEPRSLARARVWYAMGQPQTAANHAEVALPVIEAFLANNPEDEMALSARADALAILGRTEEALAESARAIAAYSLDVDAFGGLIQRQRDVVLRAMVLDSEAAGQAVDLYLQLPGVGTTFDALMLGSVFDRHRDHPEFVRLKEKYANQLEGFK
jgi:TolB-like protein/Flp pilus assembly protein TadD